MKIELIRTCTACPEQYDVMLDEEQVGYLRLRHGRFTVEYPDCGGELIFEAYPKGDGIFMEDERSVYLGWAMAAIIDKISSRMGQSYEL